jgi:radical SAM protein with 4Fe4S-binding SPASM domain
VVVTDAVLAVTYRCNSRCRICDVWRSTHNKKDEIPPEYYERLPSSLRNVNVSGGEPFLRDDLPEVIGAMGRKCPEARIVISTNGLAPSLIERTLKRVLVVKPDVGIRFSLDGIGAMHQEMRGVENAFEKVMASLDISLALGMKDTGLSFTAANENLDQLLPVYELAKSKNVTFTLCGAEHSSQIEGYLGSGTKEIRDKGLLGRQLDRLIKERLRKWSPEAMARAYYEYGIYRREAGRRRILPCGAAEVLFYMDPVGDVYSCNVANKLLGNIRHESFETIWNSKEASSSRDFARNCPYQCWMLCTVSPCLRQRPLRPMMWIAMNKIKVLVGRDVIHE